MKHQSATASRICDDLITELLSLFAYDGHDDLTDHTVTDDDTVWSRRAEVVSASPNDYSVFTYSVALDGFKVSAKMDWGPHIGSDYVQSLHIKEGATTLDVLGSFVKRGYTSMDHALEAIDSDIATKANSADDSDHEAFDEQDAILFKLKYS